MYKLNSTYKNSSYQFSKFKNQGISQKEMENKNKQEKTKNTKTKPNQNSSLLTLNNNTSKGLYAPNANATQNSTSNNFAKGTMIGATFGLLVGIIAGATVSSGDKLVDDISRGPITVLFGAVGTGLGAVVGGAIGAASSSTKVKLPLSRNLSTRQLEEKKVQELQYGL